MSNLIEQQKDAFEKALQLQYTGCVFDIDGTLTVRGDEFIPAFLMQRLAQASMNVPMAVCTGRKLSHTVEKLMPLFTYSSDPIYCQSQWILLCENGGVGYYFDTTKKTYVEFYRAEYPYPESQRENLFVTLKNKFSSLIGESFINEVSLVFRPLRYQDEDRAAVKKRSEELARLIFQEVQLHDYKKLLSIGESGVGCNVFPSSSDKDIGVRQFANYLQVKRGIQISDHAKDLAVVGDQPDTLGNDRRFLNGEYGTPFTVGDLVPESVWPLPVFVSGVEGYVSGPEGTLALLQQLKFRNGFSIS